MPSIGNWIFVSATRDVSANIGTLYINGAVSGTAKQAIGAEAAGTSNVYIGNNDASDNTFDGLITEVGIFSRVLTISEINSIYRHGLNGMRR